MLNVKKHLDMLGMPVRDRVTGFKGVVTSVGFDLYGCIQAIVNPGLGNDGKLGDQIWFDIARLEPTSNEPVMPHPAFDFDGEAGMKVVAEGHKGPAERPAIMKP